MNHDDVGIPNKTPKILTAPSTDCEKADRNQRKSAHFGSRRIFQANINEYTITAKKLTKIKANRRTSALVAYFKLQTMNV